MWRYKIVCKTAVEMYPGFKESNCKEISLYFGPPLCLKYEVYGRYVKIEKEYREVK
jgi:hypothetical protein